MYDSLIARLCAFGLAGLVSLSILTGIDALATPDPTAAILADGRTATELLGPVPAANEQPS